MRIYEDEIISTDETCLDQAVFSCPRVPKIARLVSDYCRTAD